MARTIATGPTGPSALELAFSQFGQNFGQGFSSGAQQAFQRQRQQEQLEPFRSFVEQEVTRNPLTAQIAAVQQPGAAGAPITGPGQGSQQAAVTGDQLSDLRARQDMGQRLLAEIARDPRRFADVFSTDEGGVALESIISLLQGQQPQFDVQEVNGQLVRFNPQTGEAQPIFGEPQGQEPLTQLGKLRAARERGEITDDEFRTLRQAELSGDANTQRERRIEAIQRQGFDRETATNIVDGNVRIELVPETGNARLINLLTNTVQEIPIQAGRGLQALSGQEARQAEQQTAQADTEAGQPSQEPVDPQDIFGAQAFGEELLSRTAGQIFEDAQFPDTRAARTFFRALREQTASALRSSGRVSNAEQERILSILPSTSAFESVGGAMSSLRQFRDTLEQVRDSERAFANDPQNSPKLRQEASDRVRTLDRILDQVGRIEGLTPEQQGGTPTVESVQSMSLEDARRFVEGATAEDLDQLPEDVRDALAAKLRGANGDGQ